MTADGVFTSTLVTFAGSQLPALIALVVAIILVLANWSKDHRRAAMGTGAFALALLCTLVWPPAVAASAWLTAHGHHLGGSVFNGAADFLLRALTGLAWLLIVVALFPRPSPTPPSQPPGPPPAR